MERLKEVNEDEFEGTSSRNLMEIKSGAVLIVGDGDLSFTRSLSLTTPDSVEIVGTVMETEACLCRRCPLAARNISWLKLQKYATVLFEIDATNLELVDFQREKFDHIIFNFPHPGGKTNLRKCRQLLKSFLESSKRRLWDNGRILVTLGKGQSGLPESLNPSSSEMSSLLSHSMPDHKKDSWQVIYLAAEFGLLLHSVYSFTSSDYQGYNSTGYRSSSRSFRTGEASTLVLVPAESIPREAATFDQLPQEDSDTGLHGLRPFYVHDVAFWTLPMSKFPLEKFREEVRRLSRGLVKHISFLQQFSYFCPEQQRHNLCFRFVWQSVERSLSRETTRDLQNLLRRKMEDRFSSEMLFILRG